MFALLLSIRLTCLIKIIVIFKTIFIKKKDFDVRLKDKNKKIVIRQLLFVILSSY